MEGPIPAAEDHVGKPVPSLEGMPDELLAEMCRYVPLSALYELRRACKRVRPVASAAFLASTKHLLAALKLPGPFCREVDLIRARDEEAMVDFSLGCLVRSTGLPADGTLVPIIARHLLHTLDALTEFLRGLRVTAAELRGLVDARGGWFPESEDIDGSRTRRDRRQAWVPEPQSRQRTCHQRGAAGRPGARPAARGHPEADRRRDRVVRQRPRMQVPRGDDGPARPEIRRVLPGLGAPPDRRSAVGRGGRAVCLRIAGHDGQRR
ncbi:hypothetical protein DFJ74DRAFT_122329 [Hyaloraphidium curvatum]|nr:hypothetical protein DFJ74DRAFT_122329 [Hyaloraphidium curvatum]